MELRSLSVIAGLIFCFIGSTVPVFGQTGVEPPSAGLASGPYQVGEHLTYGVAFASFTTAAHAEIWIARHGQFLDRDGLELRAHVETTEMVSAALYAINNDYTTYIDPATGLPYYTKISIHEGGREAEFSSEYNAAAGAAAIPPKIRKGEFLGVYDFLSAAYRLRAVPFTDGVHYAFSIRGENSTYDIEARPVGHQLIKSSIGSFTSLVVQLGFPHNSELDNYRIRVFFSDDERRVPLLVTAHLPHGDVQIEIASSEIVQPAPNPNGGQTGPPVVIVSPPSSGGANSGANVPGIPSTPVPMNSGGGIPGIPSNVVPMNSGSGIPGIPRTSGKQIANGAANPSGTLAVKPFPSELPFAADEALNYTVFLQGTSQPVGLVSFRVVGRNFYFGNDAIMVSAKAETANAAQKLFLANEQITSYLDPVSLLPNRTDSTFLGTRSAQSDSVLMDQDRGTATAKKGQLEIPVGTHDLLSLVYALRSFNLTPGKTSVLPLLINGKVHELTINSLKREEIQIGNQKIPAFQLSIMSKATESDRFLLRLRISDDRSRLPLRFTAKTPLGLITADLALTPAR